MWKPILNFESYEVSEEGEFRRNGRILKTKPHKTLNYRMICLQKDGKRYDKYCHRLVAETFIPNPHNKPQVNHKDGNKANNNVNNLEWATSSENALHSIYTLQTKVNCFGNSLRKVCCQKENETLIFRSLAEAGRALNCSSTCFRAAASLGTKVKGYSISFPEPVE